MLDNTRVGFHFCRKEKKDPKGFQVVVLSGVCVFLKAGRWPGFHLSGASPPIWRRFQLWSTHNHEYDDSWSFSKLETSPFCPLNVHGTSHQQTAFETPRGLAKPGFLVQPRTGDADKRDSGFQLYAVSAKSSNPFNSSFPVPAV